MKKFIAILCVMVLTALMFSGTTGSRRTRNELEITYEEPSAETLSVVVDDEFTPVIFSEMNGPEPLSDEDVDLIALMTMGEAEGESEYGKRLVIDTVFNRVDSPYFPNSIYDVVYQKNQFTAMWNGRIYRCVVTDAMRQLVREEWNSRSNYDVVFFRAQRYSDYGVPMFQEGNHYFSSYD